MKSARPKPREVVESCVLVVRDQGFLMVHRGAEPALARFLGIPHSPRFGGRPGWPRSGERVDLAETVFQLTGVRVEVGRSSRRSSSA